ncbi:MAG: S8 family peptidase [Nocardioides sp.]|uniref:S8 family peptidase n=1 Tax=Nocardioides sp. TaxID=35761 RepID=UPI003EFEE86D
MKNVRSRTAVLAASAALLVGSALAPTSALAHMPAAEPPSTPVPIATPQGQLSSYVVNVRKVNEGQIAKAERAVRAAGGTVVASWHKIGVIVVHSREADFRTEVVRKARGAVQSVGATRTTAVTEGTPGDASQPTAKARGRAGITRGEFANTVAADVVPDPREGEQWDNQMIKADAAHNVSDGSREVVVGVLDSGIDADHPDLVANIDTSLSVNCSDAGALDRSATGWQPTTSDHGTHVAGTIAAARNGVGIVGVAPGVRLASVKVVNDDGYIYPEYAVCGFMWAGLKGMDVTNNSYYVDPFMYWCSDQPDQKAAKEAVARAVAWSTKKGTVHAAAAGNAATDLATNTSDDSSPNDSTAVERTINSGCLDIPAELPGVVTVSSFARVGTTLDSELSYFSNRGLGVIDVGAPGSRILSTIVNGNGYGLKSGTSMASPHAAGVLALMVSKHPTWKPARLVAALRSQADDKACAPAQYEEGAVCVGTDADNSYAGEGMIDALDAVTR